MLASSFKLKGLILWKRKGTEQSCFW